MDKNQLLQHLMRDVTDLKDLVENILTSSSVNELDTFFIESKIKSIKDEFEFFKKFQNNTSTFQNEIVTLKEEKIELPKEKPIVEKKQNEEINYLPEKEIVANKIEKIQVEPKISETIDQKQETKIVETVVKQEIKEIIPAQKFETDTIENLEPEIVPEPVLTKMTEKIIVEKPVKKEVEKKLSIGEQLKAEQKTLQEVIAEQNNETDLNTKLKKNPISDIKSAITLNERFWFANELFDGNHELFISMIDVLNNIGTFDDSMSYIKEKFTWDFESLAVRKLIQLIERRYNN